MQFIGGLALLWIAVKLLAGDKEEVKCEGASNFWGAIRVIIVADAIMSLDNVLAVAGIAQGNIPLLLFGLALSIPLVVFGSQMFLKVMDRFPVMIYAGSAILGCTAGEMVASDSILGVYFHSYALFIKVVFTAGVLGMGYWLKSRHTEQPVAEPVAETQRVSI